MKRHARVLVAIAGLVALLTSGCAQGADQNSKETASAARSDASERSDEETSPGSKDSRSKAASSAVDAESNPGSTSDAPGGGSNDAAGSGEVALGSAEIVDDVSDRVGAGSGYAEITGASVVGRGDEVTFSVEVASALPKRLPKDSNLIVGIGVQEDAEHGAIAVIAQGTAAGWTAVLQDAQGSRPVEKWALEGKTVTWTVPWSWVEGPRPFEWGASLQLFDFSTQAGAASDKAPNAGPEAFPHD